ncbi:MAG TPA: hypothetical protein VLA11_02740 [Woeseiaceae bacterium]|jgi:hypothetical protein|nr:hypothetical protein [Woeseiaceae bacterium]
MNWEAVGAIGELVGAIAVIITLLYVGRQIHEANAQTQAMSRYSLIEALGQINVLVANSKENASVFRRGLQNEELDADESIQFLAMLGQFTNVSSVLFDLHNDGLLPDNQWHLIRNDTISIFSEPGGRKFWNKVGRCTVHADFRDAVDEALASGDRSYKIT